MNFAQMLMQANKVISTPVQQPAKPPGTMPNGRTRSMKHVYEARMAKSRADYRKAMYDENLKEQKWYTSEKIESRAGRVRGGSYDVLQNLVKGGYIERRPAGGGEFNRRHGWEYRWIGE